MKKFAIVISAAVVLTIAAVAFFRPDGDAPKLAVQTTRLELRNQGFKTDLADFNFFTSLETREREGALTNLTSSHLQGNLDSMKRFFAVRSLYPDLMSLIGNDAAEPLAREDLVDAQTGKDIWGAVREGFDDVRGQMDEARAAALAGPIKFHLDAGRGVGMLLPHLSAIKGLVETFGVQMALDLHDAKQDEAWTNLLAATRLVNAWEIEPVDLSYLIRASCVETVFGMTWQAFHARDWPEDKLAQLEAEWSKVNFFVGLPEIAAFQRASFVAACQDERTRPVAASQPISAMIQSPRSAYYEIQSRRAHLRYLQRGTFEDEKGLLLFYRDRELESRRATNATTWMEMRSLPGVTNAPLYQTHGPSFFMSMISSKQLMLNWSSRGVGVFARTAESETYRRVILSVIAIERHRAKYGSYPKTLSDVSQVPANGMNNAKEFVDFMDGKPLRYRITNDGQFVLYSCGLDCIDNGGITFVRLTRGQFGQPLQLGIVPGKDLAWPRAASEEEVKLQEKREEEEDRAASLSNYGFDFLSQHRRRLTLRAR